MSTSMFLSVVMAIMTIMNPKCTQMCILQEKEILPLAEAIVREAETEADGCDSRCFYPQGWEWLEDLHSHEMLKSIGMESDGTVIVTVDGTVLNTETFGGYPEDCFQFVEGIFEDPQGEWFIASKEFDELGQPVWSVENAKGWKAKLVFTDLDTD